MKKVLALLLVVMMLVSLVACGGNKNDDGKFPTLTYLYNTNDNHRPSVSIFRLHLLPQVSR